MLIDLIQLIKYLHTLLPKQCYIFSTLYHDIQDLHFHYMIIGIYLTCACFKAERSSV